MFKSAVRSERAGWFRFVALMIALALVLVACGDDDDDVAADSPTTTSGDGTSEEVECTDPDELKISMGVFDYGLFAAFFVARENGLMAEQCVAPDYILMPGSTAAQALISGDIDLSTSSTTAMAAGLRGLPIVVIGAFTEVPTYNIWTARPDDVTSLEDLAGNSVGVQELGDSYEELWILTLLEAGVDPSQVTFLSVGGGEGRFQALVANSVAAVPLLGTEETRIEEAQPAATLLANPAEMGVRQHVGGLATERSILEEKEDAIYRFLVAIRKGMLFVRDNPDEAARIWAETQEMRDIGATQEQLRSSIEDFFIEDTDFLVPTGSHDLETQERIVQVKKDFIVDDVDADMTAEDVFDFSLIERAFEQANEEYEEGSG